MTAREVEGFDISDGPSEGKEKQFIFKCTLDVMNVCHRGLGTVQNE